MKNILIIIFITLNLQAIGNNFKYVSKSEIMAIYKGILLNPKCINGKSVENGVNTTCYVHGQLFNKMYFQKGNYNRIVKLTKEIQLNKILVCSYQALGDMYYNCEPMSEKNKKKFGYK